ncbi:MAG: cupin domain-containing protein [Sulfobacillus sp.]
MATEEARKNEAEVEWIVHRSPKGVFESNYRWMSRSLNVSAKSAYPEEPAMPRPFEVDLVRIRPGMKYWPRHSHSVQWEYYIVLSGRGRMLQADGVPALPMEPGDHLLQPAGWIHTVENNGDEDLFYYVIANNPLDEVNFYPDSNKWSAADRTFRIVEADYWDGEE